MFDIVFVSLENWDEIWRRNQFLCAAYARRYPQCQILFVGQSRDVSHHLRRGILSQLREENARIVPGLPNITLMRPLKLFPNTLTAGRKLNEHIARVQIRHVARQIRLNQPILWLNPHDAVHMAGRMDERAVIYDITDDWISPTQSVALSRHIAAQDAALCRCADAVIVCSEKLFAMKRGLAGNLHLIPNGVDANHYRGVLDDTSELPAVTTSWPKPVLGYTGTLHDDRIDIELIEAIAGKLRTGSIVLIGPNHLSANTKTRLGALPNVFLPGVVPYQNIPEYMRAFDVCITPHRVTPFTESLNPIKLWEYLAAGKPIVSTNVAGFRDYPQYVHIANDADGFLAAVQTAFHESPDTAELRRKEARCHSWESRLDAVEAVFTSCSLQTTQTTKATAHDC